jgi:alkaline phosphatase D
LKTADPFWFDLFHRRGSRRDFLRAGAGAAALVSLGALPARAGDRSPRFRDDPFTLGVASGDPLPDGVVLWTRLDADALAAPGGAGTAGGPAAAAVPVRWEVAADEAFRTIVRSGAVEARPALGHSVHAEVSGLEPGRTYHYRFLAGGAASPVGRTRTAPAAGAPTERFRFAFASCQHYQHGHYTAYRHMVEEDLDLVVHLGDYIYEADSGENRIRAHDGLEVFSLDQYRSRYALYRGDPALMAAHASFPWVVTWDDHEVDNNYAGGVPADLQHPEAFLLRRAAAYQAFYEFMPLRRSSMPRGSDLRLYRRFEFGDLVSLPVVDTRQHRSDQACGDGNRMPCAEWSDPARTLLGAEQERWLIEGLRASRARWNVVANQVLMARLERRATADGATLPMDTWDGYPGARARLLEAFASGGVSNPVVLTGDIHSSWVNDLVADFDDPGSRVVATELVGTSITSGGDGRDVFPGFEDTQRWNPHIRFYHGRRGYVGVDITPARLTARFRTVPWVTQPGAPVRTAATWVVEDGRPGAVREG